MGATDGPPTMMSFKAFLAAQDDSITVDDAIQKYNEYKLEFRRQQLNEFFVAHKDEEWYVTYYSNYTDTQTILSRPKLYKYQNNGQAFTLVFVIQMS